MFQRLYGCRFYSRYFRVNSLVNSVGWNKVAYIALICEIVVPLNLIITIEFVRNRIGIFPQAQCK